MIQTLKVYNVGQKIRIGKESDGGYVLPNICVEKSNQLFSYGIKDEISFDEHYIELTNKLSNGFDHTILDIDSKYKENFIFHKEGISGVKTEITNNFTEHYKNKNLTERVLLKVDVEGCEYEWLNNTDIQYLSNIVSGIVIEFHDLMKKEFRDNFFNLIKEINNYFYICHIHGNNYGETFEYIENDTIFNLPDVIEITFLPKDISSKCEIDYGYYPTDLDKPNAPYLPDIELSFLKQISTTIL